MIRRSPFPSNSKIIQKENIPPTRTHSVPPKANTLQPHIKTLLPQMTSPPIPDPNKYLAAPLTTLSESLEPDYSDHLCTHDLLDAYATLACRLRTLTLSPPTSSGSVLDPDAAKTLVQCLTRDTHASFSRTQHQVSTAWSLSSDSTTTTVDELELQQGTRDVSMLTHYALRVLSHIVHFPALYQFFSPTDQSTLLSSLLSLIVSSRPSKKTLALAMYALRSIRIPHPILVTKGDEVSAALRVAIDFSAPANVRKDGDDGDGNIIVSDGLKAIHLLTKSHPSTFLSSTSSLLPSILPHLLSPLQGVFQSATFALAGFALGVLSLPSPFTSSIPYAPIRKFIDLHHSSLKLPSNARRSTNTALSILSSLTILAGPLLFTHPRLLKLVLFSLASVDRQRRQKVWRCVVWAFSCLGPGDRGTREQAFKVVKQELGGGIGAALVGVLLDTGWKEAGAGEVDTEKALDVIREMLAFASSSSPTQSHSTTHSEGVILFSKLVLGIDEGSKGKEKRAWDRNEVVCRALFDKRVLKKEWYAEREGEREGEDVVRMVRALEEGEIIRSWDKLMEIWALCIDDAFHKDGGRMLDDLIRMWQRLLLVQAQLTQGNGHFEAEAGVTKRIVAVLTACLAPSLPVPGSELTHQRCTLVRRLWGVITNVFGRTWLMGPAEAVLRAVVRSSPGDDAWDALCLDLVRVVGAVVIIDVCREEDGDGRARLWRLVAGVWAGGEAEAMWTDLVSFLVVPLRQWAMSDYEIEQWDTLLRRTISLAGSVGVRIAAVIDAIIAAQTLDHAAMLSSSPKATLAFLTHVHLGDRDTLPNDLCRVIDDTLCVLYPPPEELVRTALEILRSVRDIITSAGALLLVPLLVALRKGVCVWIEDEKEVVSEDEYNAIIAPLYCDTLSSLHMHPSTLTLNTLHALTPFLASAFVRIPPPALGPLAFADFWRATYHRPGDAASTAYPDRIKMLLRAFDDAFDGGLAVGLSIDTESQLTPSFEVPDSQPEPEEGACDHSVTDILRGLENHSDGKAAPSPSTPVRKDSHNSRTPVPDHLVAFNQLGDYSSRMGLSVEGESRPTGDTPEYILRPVLKLRGRHTLSSPSPLKIEESSSLVVQHHAKRSLLDSQEWPPAEARPGPFKRRKTDPEAVTTVIHTAVPSRDLVRRRRKHGAREVPRIGSKAASEPIARVTSAVELQDAPQSVMIHRKRTLLDYVELPSLRDVLKRPRSIEQQEDSPGFGPPRKRMCSSSYSDGITSPLRGSPTSFVDDYDSWEAALSTSEMHRIQRELTHGGSPEVPETPASAISQEQLLSPRRGSEPIGDRTIVMDSPLQDKVQRLSEGRSQTVPTVSHLTAPPLRRSRTTSSRLGTLHEAYTLVTNDASQMPVQDLLQATRLVHQLGSVLNEQMAKKLGNNH